MEFKVKEVGQGQEKSKAEIEEQLLNEHEEKIQAQESVETPEVESVNVSTSEETDLVEPIKETPSSGVNDENVLSYIKENNQSCYNQPLGKLRICSTPVWSDRHREWMYYYEYGFGYTSEGMTVQSKLVKVTN